MVRHLANLRELRYRILLGLEPAESIAEIGNFWYEFAPKEYIPLVIFQKFGMGRVSQVRILTPNFTVLA